MKRILAIVIIITSCTNNKTLYDFKTHFEKSNGLETATYYETIAFYEDLAEVYSEIAIDSLGITDSGKPLHIVTFNTDNKFNFKSIRKDKRILLINNGIHPGESDGIDATMLLFRDLAMGKIPHPKNTVLVTIPIYNVGGSLNRNTTSRTNQNGPSAYGFRGNARNYDLNRDFIKCDTRNARTFTEIFHLINPDVFIDNHVSNGADYQYTLTHLFTQHNKLGGNLGDYVHTKMMPKLEEKLKKKDWDITPYVNVFNRVPEEGFSQFMDYPRYSTGYTALFNTLGMMVETHMLKPYKQRVEGTYELMKSMIEIIEHDGKTIAKMRTDNLKLFKIGDTYPLNWDIDTTKHTLLNFKGYDADTLKSEITGSNRLKYDRSKPFSKKVTYQNYFKPRLTVKIPKAYIIPKGWHSVIDILKLNQVEMHTLKKDTTLTVGSYKISNYGTRSMAYEGHYSHHDVDVISTQKTMVFKQGDFIINTQQLALKYIMETLEPQAPDSFFNWNFFDTILQQKEGFSPYVWEDKALELLKSDDILMAEFNNKKQTDSTFAKNWYAQLDWIHKQSKAYEKAHLQYPVFRIN